MSSFIEKLATKLKLIPDLSKEKYEDIPRLTEPGQLDKFPPPESWDHWEEYEAKAWPKKEKKAYSIVPIVELPTGGGGGGGGVSPLVNISMS